jgi:hypothetical protein
MNLYYISIYNTNGGIDGKKNQCQSSNEHKNIRY